MEANVGTYYGAGGSIEGGNDANAALAELDQNLRCGRIGEQSEAIVRFPTIFAKYPFPILINSALLKLADVFRQGNNFIKLCVLCVVRQSDKHLDKITNVDEFVKRIFAVIHSNDPVARALTLKMLGAVASVIPERRQAHNSIRHAMDSQDAVELKAAIYSASCFAARSKSFAINMCSKISEMIKGYATPPEMKLRLIPMFQHMHQDAHTAKMVRKTCIEMLPGYPSEDFVAVTLRTLTRLSSHTLVDIPEQVELLLKNLNEDPRREVMRQALSDLKFLAQEERAHAWLPHTVDCVVEFALDHRESESSAGSDTEALVGALSILCDLVRFTSTSKLSDLDGNSPIVKLCQACSYSTQLPVAARSTQLLTLLAINCAREMQPTDGVDLTSEAVLAIEALFLLINSGNALQASSGLRVLKECLTCVVQLCRVQPKASDQFVDIVGGMLLSSNKETVLLLCEVLASFAGMKKGVLRLLLPDICNAITTVIESEVSEGSTAPVLTYLATLLFQTLKGHAWPQSALVAIKNALSNVDQWSAYCIARAAARYGHHGIASEVFEKISCSVASEHLYFWNVGLSQVCKGEHALNDITEDDLVSRISTSNTHILEGLTSIRASYHVSKNQEFQIDFLRCRSDFLQILAQIVYTCHSLRTAPPPAIASSQAKALSDDLQRCGHVITLLRGCVTDLMNAGAAFNHLYSTSFDADANTLAHIHIMQHLCLSLSQWIEMVCLKSTRHGSLFGDSNIAFTPTLVSVDNNIEIQDLLSVGEKVADCFRKLVANPDTPAPVTDAHTTCLLDVVSILASSQIGLPRFFFQSLQNTK